MKSDDCVAGDDHRCARSTKHLAIVGESERRRRRTSIWSSAVDEKVYNFTRQPQAKYLELNVRGNIFDHNIVACSIVFSMLTIHISWHVQGYLIEMKIEIVAVVGKWTGNRD